tara:strand:+ start:71 stop:913 length:843 start_codon:yes stop_codon:yes gene_type:complete
MLFFSSPFHCLRKSRLFERLVSSRFNEPRYYDLKFPFPIALRPITHASIRWRRGRIEGRITSLFKALLRTLEKLENQGSFYDVGANVGLYSWIAKSLNPTRKVLAFEPDPQNSELLERTRTHSDIQGMEVHQVALSCEKGLADFHQDGYTSATGMLADDQVPWVEKYLGKKTNIMEVEKRLMDDFPYTEGAPALIKIDVEGHELEVLHGGLACLLKSKPLLLLESFPPKLDKVVDFLHELGYETLDAETRKTIDHQTNNLFAWHSEGPLPQASIRKIIQV